jgi:hypothetical protein
MNGKTKVEIRVDTYTRVCLTVIAVLLMVTVLGLWCQAVPSVSSLAAAGPAAGAGIGAGTASGTEGSFGDTNVRIAAQLEAIRLTNTKLDEIIKLLSGGQVKVQVVKDERAGGANGQQPKN